MADICAHLGITLGNLDAALQGSIILRLLLWICLFLLVCSAIWASERLTRKLEGTKNNAAHGQKLHRKRIRQYAWRRTLAVALGVILPSIVLSIVLLFPKPFLGPGHEAALRCPSAMICDNTSLMFAFVADQVLQGAFSDFGEIFRFGVSGYTLDLDRVAVRTMLSVYRLILNVYGLVAVVLLGRVLIDRAFIGFPIGVANGDKRYLNLAGLSRGGPISGYADEPLGPNFPELVKADPTRVG